MDRKDKVISLELAKQIDAEHKRLGIEPPVSEWWWNWLTPYKEDAKLVNSCNKPSNPFWTIPAYDLAELFKEMNGIEDIEDVALWHIRDINIETAGEKYLELLQVGYIGGSNGS